MNIKIFLAGCFFGMSALSVEAQQVWTPDNGDGTFTNPIMWGDWPDPDVIRVGDDFYFVSTKLLQKSGIRKNVVIELIYRGFI